jgi:hypothetical protein
MARKAQDKKPKRNTHGGHRAGAGRKPIGDKNMRPHLVYISDELWDYFKVIGTYTTVDGKVKQDAARGIRVAGEFHQSLAHQFHDTAPDQPTDENG